LGCHHPRGKEGKKERTLKKEEERKKERKRGEGFKGAEELGY